MGFLRNHGDNGYTKEWHLLSLLLVTVNLIFLCLIIFNSTPLTSSSTLRTSDYSGTNFYLLTVNETENSVSTINNDKLIQFGFGVWGWCETNQGNTAVNPSCALQPGYQLPQSAEESDPVAELNLSWAIRVGFSPCAILLIIPTIRALTITLFLFISLFRPIILGARVWYQSDWFYWVSFVFVLFEFPIIICATAAIGSSNEQLNAKFGIGMAILVVGAMCDLVAEFCYTMHGLTSDAMILDMLQQMEELEQQAGA